MEKINFAEICKEIEVLAKMQVPRLTITKLATELGVTDRAWRYWREGKKVPSGSEAFALVEKLRELKTCTTSEKIESKLAIKKSD